MNDISELIKSVVGQNCKFRLGQQWGSLKGRIESFDGKWLKIQTKSSIKLINLRQIVYIDLLDSL